MLAMWVPELPFQLAAQRDGSLRGHPLAFLSPGKTPVATLWMVDALARKEGVRPGDPMDFALQRVRGLRVLDPTPQVWWEAQAGFRDFLGRWTPQGLIPALGEALIELHGTSRLHGAPPDAARRIQRELRASHGWMSQGGLSTSATAAGFASRMAEPFVEIKEGAERAFLAPMPIHRLSGLPRRWAWRFRRLGLHELGDLQPIPCATLAGLVQPDEAPKLLAKVRGEDRLRLPMLTEPPGRSRHRWRLEPPRLPEAVPLARWFLEVLWADPRSLRALTLQWWDVDGLSHRWAAPMEMLVRPPLAMAPAVARAFCALATRRMLVHRLELHLRWGLGQPVGLFQCGSDEKLGRLEGAMARLRQRFPDAEVRPGWLAAEAGSPYRATRA
ncbi:MAG: hypothetical protein JST05_07265 [Acidobacteria bacterium]|nr:hypothetical protein [Acidobacteriota bacterium]